MNGFGRNEQANVVCASSIGKQQRTKDKALLVLMIESERRGFSPIDIVSYIFCLISDIISYVFCCSNTGVARVMKEIKLSCCKCHFEFFTTVANRKQDTNPSLLISLPSLSHLHSQTGRGSIRHLHISRNTPCLPSKHLVYALSSIFVEVIIIPRRNF